LDCSRDFSSRILKGLWEMGRELEWEGGVGRLGWLFPRKTDGFDNCGLDMIRSFDLDCKPLPFQLLDFFLAGFEPSSCYDSDDSFLFLG
jgi:hypothetical protein